jgi:hypothetical protein
MVRLIALALLVIAACGNITPHKPDDAAIPHDAADAAIDNPDASPDSAPLKEAREFVSGGTRMTGATYTLEVQVGHDVQPGKIMSSTYQLEGNAAVKP